MIDRWLIRSTAVALIVGACVLSSSEEVRAQLLDLVTVIITLRSQVDSTAREAISAAFDTARGSSADPVAADRGRSVAVSRALSAIEATTRHDADLVRDEVSRLGGNVVRPLRSIGVVIARVPRGAISALLELPQVVAIDEDVTMAARLDVATASMGVPAFWGAGYTGGSTDVAVVDSGLYIGNAAFTARPASISCAVYHANAVLAPNYADNPLTCDDLQGHGTGVIGMVFSQGTAAFPTRRGVAYGIDRLYNLKAAFRTTSGSGAVNQSDVYIAVDSGLAQSDPPEVINISAGLAAAFDDYPIARFYDAVVGTFGTTITVSAGNQGLVSIDDSTTAYNAIAVANVNDQGTTERSNDVVHSTSSRGPTPGGRRKPDIAAPGTGIFSTSTLGGFESVTGTSYSSPAIAGAAALLVHAGVTDARAVKAVVINSADDYGAPGWDVAYGWGYYNGASAFAQRSQFSIQTLGPPGSLTQVRFYERPSSAATKASLVWNRHVTYIGAAAPSAWFLNNLDLVLYGRDSGALRLQSRSTIDNVEQVSLGLAEPAVLVVESIGAFTGTSETFALAHSGGFVQRSGPRITTGVTAPASVGVGTTFTVNVQLANPGDLAGHQFRANLVVPAGFILVAGANPQLLGSIQPSGAATGSWTLRAPNTPTSAPVSLVVNGDTTSFGWVSAGSGSASVTVTGGSTDTDTDALPNEWETLYGLDPSSAAGADGASGDPDGDGQTNLQEFQSGTHPRGFFRRYLAEGALNNFFDVRLALLNVGIETANVLLRFQQPGSATLSRNEQLPVGRRRTLTRADLSGLSSPDFSTVVESDQAILLDRTMSWGSTGYGSHAETGVPSPATTWYLAEGSTSTDFALFYLLQNPNPTATTATVRYLLPGGQPPIELTYPLAPNSRTTIPVDDQGPALASTDVSAVVTAPLPIIVERAMYISRPGQVFAAGHGSAGVTSPALSWFLAEGATGPFFDLFILIANPNPQPAQVTANYLLLNGTTLTKDYVVPANSRFTIWVDDEQIPAGSGTKPLDNVAVSTTITSTNGVPIIVERAMWWPSPALTTNFWTEAHNSPGATVTGTRWGLAEGEVGGSLSAETYILVANTSTSAGQARVTLYFEDGTSAVRTVALLGRSRTNVAVSSDFPEAAGRRFGALIESLGVTPAQIVVERAMYTSPGGVTWAAGTNALATRLP